jgi:hypothetical protein
LISAKTVPFCIRDGQGRWIVWRMAPTGWTWAAEFALKRHAEDFLSSQLCQDEV